MASILAAIISLMWFCSDHPSFSKLFIKDCDFVLQLRALEEVVPHRVLLHGLPLVPGQGGPGEGVVDSGHHPTVCIVRYRRGALLTILQPKLKLRRNYSALKGRR